MTGAGDVKFDEGVAIKTTKEVPMIIHIKIRLFLGSGLALLYIHNRDTTVDGEHRGHLSL